MTNSGKMILGMTCGAVAGLAIGFLLAPSKGSDTRHHIAQTTGTWVNQFGQLFTKGRRKVREEMAIVKKRKEAAEERVNKIKQGLG